MSWLIAFKKYLYNYQWGQITELAYKIGKSHSYIHRRLKLLESSPEVIDAISQLRLEPSIAEEIQILEQNCLISH